MTTTSVGEAAISKRPLGSNAGGGATTLATPEQKNGDDEDLVDDNGEEEEESHGDDRKPNEWHAIEHRKGPQQQGEKEKGKKQKRNAYKVRWSGGRYKYGDDSPSPTALTAPPDAGPETMLTQSERSSLQPGATHQHSAAVALFSSDGEGVGGGVSTLGEKSATETQVDTSSSFDDDDNDEDNDEEQQLEENRSDDDSSSSDGSRSDGIDTPPKIPHRVLDRP